jgi:hypothetical protein
MADSTISQLPTALVVLPSAFIAIDQGGVTQKVALAQLGNGTVLVANGKILTVSNSLTLAGTDGTILTFPSTTATIARTDAAQTFTGDQTFSGQIISTVTTGTPPFSVTSTTPVTNLSIGGNSATATALQNARTIDGVSFDGTANITVIAPATHAAPNKTTPDNADEFTIWNSVTGLLAKVTFANLVTAVSTGFTSIFAALAGSASQVFSVGDATSADHAAKLKQVSLFPTVASATSPDIFGAAGVTINYDNTTPVTATSFAACTTAQIGSTKTIIPTADANFTASANLIIDGATSGTYLMPANAIVQVLALSTTQFKITTIEAYGTWTPNQGTGLTVVGAFNSSGTYKVVGGVKTVTGVINPATSVAVAAGGHICENMPFTSSVGQTGTVVNGNANSGAATVIAGTTLYCSANISSSPNISFTITYT